MNLNEYQSIDGMVDQSNLGSTKPRDMNFGVYGQIGGSSISISYGTDGLTVGLGGQLSSIYSVSGTSGVNFSNGKVTAAPSVYQGVGTPTGWPGLSTSVGFSPDGKSTQFQIGLGINDLVEAGISFSFTDKDAPASSLNSGPTNWRGNGFTDPRILDNSGGYRGLNTYSGVYASQAAENAAFEQDWNTALNAYSMEPSYTSFPTDPAAYNGYSDAFGDNSSSSNTDTSGWYDAGGYDNAGGYDAGGYDYGGYDDYYDYSYDFYDYGGGDWYPLVIDLDGDGVEIKPLDRSTTTFDIDNDGYKERTAWVGADDGMLVIDLNGDNQITQSREMAFGEWTSEQDTDLQALAKVFDSNGDGTFDSRDSQFNEFRIWKDANSNGVADAGEMMTLQEAGIASIATTVKDGTALDLSDGTSIAGLFKVQRTDGKLVDGADVAFAYQKTGVKETVDAQGNKVFTFEDGGVYKHMVMNSTQTDVTLPDASGVNWIGVTGNAANDVLYRRYA